MSGMPTSPRERVLHLVVDLLHMQLPSLHVCVTSCPEVDIKEVLEPLAYSIVSLHDESGQQRAIASYVRNVVYSDRKMRKWRHDDKELVVEELTEKRMKSEDIASCLLVGPLIAYRTGSDGCSVSKRCCGTVSQRVFGGRLTNYPKHWMRHRRLYLDKSLGPTKRTPTVCCSVSRWPFIRFVLKGLQKYLHSSSIHPRERFRDTVQIGDRRIKYMLYYPHAQALKPGHHHQRSRVSSCPIFSFLRKGVLDVGSAHF